MPGAGWRTKKDIGIASFLFFTALLPRVFGLNAFLTADEFLWIKRSAQFLAAIVKGDWAGTFIVGHPGLTTRWTGALGITARYLPQLRLTGGRLWIGNVAFEDFLQGLSDHIMDVLAATRLPTALLASLCVVGAYLLLKRLFDQRVALLSAVLLALDPFYLALSRVIHHDALTTSFTLISLLSFMLYLREDRPFHLILSGLTAGLAFLSKSPSLFLVPFTALMSLIAYWGRGKGFRPLDWREAFHLGRGWALWGILAALLFTALWPAMWVDPWGTVQGVMDKAIGYAGAPHERANFFMGRFRLDPGPLFYPVALLFRLTPLTLLGAWISPLSLIKRIRARDRWPIIHLSFILAFIPLYLAFMTSGAKKFDRYSLPVFPLLDIVAAIGWIEALGLAASRWRDPFRFLGIPLKRGLRPAMGLGLALLLQGSFSLPHYPYYLTCYNPLLGGIQGASRVLLVGWGEGLERAAEYLNSKEEAARLSASAWYDKHVFGPLFRGQSYKLPVDSQQPIGVVPWYETDYVVFYINQVQRTIPSIGTVDFFRTRRPEYTVRLAGLDYAWVYRVPQEVPLEAYPYQITTMVDFGDAVRLLGYDVENQPFELGGRHYLDLTFYWQSLRPIVEDYRVYLKLIDGQGRVWSERDIYPVFDGFRTSQWKKGLILRDRHGLEISPDIPPGTYQVSVKLFDPDVNKGLAPAGEDTFTLKVNIDVTFLNYGL